MASISDTLITKRERMLNLALRVDPSDVLNPGFRRSETGKVGLALAADLKISLNKISALAINADGSQVDYEKIIDNPLYKDYRQQVLGLVDFDYGALKSNDQKLAFWLNLYNSLVIDSVIQEKVQNSVTESRLGIMAFFQKAAYTINGQRFSLTDIEHGTLRGNRGFPYLPGLHFAGTDPRIDSVIPNFDPRIHFALNCASNSCPPIGVYDPEHIQDQLDLAAKNFITNDLIVEPEKNLLSASKIFQWYLNDFGGKKSLPGLFLENLKDGETRNWINENQSSLKITFHEYDWGLNITKQ